MKQGRLKLGFSGKVFIGAMLLMFLPIFLFSFLFSSSLNQISHSQAKQEAGAVLADADNRLSQLNKISTDMATKLSNEALLCRSLVDQSINPNTIYLLLYQKTLRYPVPPVINVYDTTGKLKYTTSQEYGPTKLPVNWGILKIARESDGPVRQTTGRNPDAMTLATAKALNYSGIRVGYVCVDYPPKVYEDYLKQPLHTDYELSVLDRHGRPLFTSNPLQTAYEKSFRQWLMEQGQDPDSYFSALADEAGSASLVLADYNEEYDYTLLLRFPKPLSTHVDSLFRQLRLLSLLAIFAFSLLFSLLISRSLSGPILTLNQTLDRAKAGDLNVKIKHDRQDELGDIMESFNEILRQLQYNVDEKIRQTNAMNQAHILLMQSQLTPHFLYNTLDTIKWLTMLGRTDDAAFMTEKLAKLLRRCVSNRHLVSLIEEVDTIESYLEIQSIRFSGNFVHGTYFPAGLEAALVPNMILQPIVENAIIHGLKNREEGYIYIQARQEGTDQLVLSVTDNGRGMAPDKLEAIRNALDCPDLKGDHLGLHNVKQILKRIWGDKATLTIHSIEKVGTEVTLYLPLLFREEKEGQSR